MELGAWDEDVVEEEVDGSHDADSKQLSKKKEDRRAIGYVSMAPRISFNDEIDLQASKSEDVPTSTALNHPDSVEGKIISEEAHKLHSLRCMNVHNPFAKILYSQSS